MKRRVQGWWAAEKGADIDSKINKNYGQTPLSWAAGSGHKATVQLLLEKGADFDLKDKAGRTPLSYAIERGHNTIIQLLHKYTS
jgi:ankyrin repeat protein